MVVTDTITEPLRRPLLVRTIRSSAERRALARGEEIGEPKAWRSWTYDLLTCPWCIGFWIAAATTTTYLTIGTHPAYQVAATALAASYIVGWLSANEGD